MPPKEQISPSPVAYTISDFCLVMGFGRSKTYELIKAGKLKAVKIAGRTLVPATEAQRLVTEAMS